MHVCTCHLRTAAWANRRISFVIVLGSLSVMSHEMETSITHQPLERAPRPRAARGNLKSKMLFTILPKMRVVLAHVHLQLRNDLCGWIGIYGGRIGTSVLILCII